MQSHSLQNIYKYKQTKYEMKKEKKEKICNFCQNIINLSKDKHVLLGTYNGELILDENYFHFECFREWYNSKLKEKMQNTMQEAGQKVMGMLKNIYSRGVFK